MTSIYRYEVPVDDLRHRIALHGDPHGVGCRRLGVVEFWAVYDPAVPMAERSFLVVGTGHPLPLDALHVWGHAVDGGGALIWHLVEVTP